VDKVNVTSITSSAWLHCQQYNGSVPCDADTLCKWDPVQYYKNYCSGSNLVVAVDGAACPSGSTQIAFPADTYPNPKFKCCRIESSGGTGGSGGGGSTTGNCCNPAGNVVPSLQLCPTPSNPYQCCNPGGQPVGPMVGAGDQCNKGIKPFDRIRKR
jgi:hypothetical protein